MMNHTIHTHSISKTKVLDTKSKIRDYRKNNKTCKFAGIVGGSFKTLTMQTQLYVCFSPFKLQGSDPNQHQPAEEGGRSPEG